MSPLSMRMRADPSKASLFTATDAIGLPEEIVLQLAEKALAAVRNEGAAMDVVVQSSRREAMAQMGQK